MEFAKDGNLEKYLFKCPPDSWEVIYYWALCAAVSLDIIHRAGVAHRDLHPGNLVFHGARSRGPQVIDVGLSCAIERCAGEDVVYGRLDYLPPESFDGKPSTQRSDIYCFGTLM